MSAPQCGSRFPATVSRCSGSTGRDGDAIRDIGGRSFRRRLYGPFCGGPPACRPLITALCAATASAAVAGSTRCAASTAANPSTQPEQMIGGRPPRELTNSSSTSPEAAPQNQQCSRRTLGPVIRAPVSRTRSAARHGSTPYGWKARSDKSSCGSLRQCTRLSP